MKRLLLISHLDPDYFDNSRFHHLIAYFRDVFEEVCVLYLQHVTHPRRADQLASFCRLDLKTRQEGSVRFIGVHPLFASGKPPSAVHSAPPSGGSSSNGLLQTARRTKAEMIGLAGYLLESTYGRSLLHGFSRADGTRYDAVIAGGVWALDCALELKGRGQVRMVFCDDYDFSPGNYMNSALRRALVRRFENCRLQRCDGVVSVGRLLRDLREKETGQTVEVIPNGIVREKLEGARQKQPHPPTIIYVGSVEEWSGLDIVLQALAIGGPVLETLHLVVVGHGSEGYIQGLKEQAARLGLESRFRFAGKQPFDRIADFLARADVGLATFRPYALRKYAASLKVVEYLSAGVCPLVTEKLQAAECIDEHGCGMTTPCEPEAIASALTTLFTEPDCRAESLERGESHIRQLEWKTLMWQYHRLLQQRWDSLVGNAPVTS